MHTELRFAGWTVDRVGPIGENWVRGLWLPKARELLATIPRAELFRRPTDHSQRMQRTLLSLEGLAIGDAVGEMLGTDMLRRDASLTRDFRPGPGSIPTIQRWRCQLSMC